MSKAPNWASEPSKIADNIEQVKPAKVAQKKALGRPKNKVATKQKTLRFTDQAQRNTNALHGQLLAHGLKMDDSELIRHLVAWAAKADEQTINKIAGFIELQQED